MKFGKYKGLEISQLPVGYLRFIVDTFGPCEIRDEAKKVLNGTTISQEQKSKSLEEQANEILGEKPIGLLRRGKGRRKNG
jgi:hypothetical protein